MKRSRPLAALAVVLLTLAGARAQTIPPDPVPQRAFRLWIGSAPVRLHDAAQSPLRYGGGAFAGRLSYRKGIPDRHRSMAILDGAAGRLTAEPWIPGEAIAQATAYRGALRVTHERALRANAGPTRLWLGGALLGLADVRVAYPLDNSFLPYQVALGIGPSFSATRAFTALGHAWTLEGQVAVPLVQRVWRPERGNRFNFLDPEFDLIADALDNGRWLGPNRAFRLVLDAGLAYRIRSGNALLLGYGWDFTHLADGPRLTGAAHRLQVGASFAF